MHALKLKHEVHDYDAWTRAEAKKKEQHKAHHALEHSTEVSSPAGSADGHSLKHTTTIAYVRW
jgi:hypothetical protein